MARYRVSRKAIRDLDGIWYSLAKDSEAAAARLRPRLRFDLQSFMRNVNFTL